MKKLSDEMLSKLLSARFSPEHSVYVDLLVSKDHVEGDGKFPVELMDFLYIVEDVSATKFLRALERIGAA